MARWAYKLLAIGLAAGLAMPVAALDWPLSNEAIREAYFLGTHQTSVGDHFLPEYTRTIPGLRVGNRVSLARMETPFYQVAARTVKAHNYSAQDAAEEFSGKPAVVRLYLEICYQVDAPLPNAVKVGITQKESPVEPLSEQRTGLYPPSSRRARVSNLGEKITLELDPEKLDAPELTIQIDTPDGQEAVVEFDLRSLR